jgi:hypothetical protein
VIISLGYDRVIASDDAERIKRYKPVVIDFTLAEAGFIVDGLKKT